VDTHNFPILGGSVESELKPVSILGNRAPEDQPMKQETKSKSKSKSKSKKRGEPEVEPTPTSFFNKNGEPKKFKTFKVQPKPKVKI